MRKSKLRFWGFLAPSLIAFCIVVIIPTCIGFFYSLTNWNGIVGSDIKFVGFQNFIDIFTRDDSFVHAFLFTALFFGVRSCIGKLCWLCSGVVSDTEI